MNAIRLSLVLLLWAALPVQAGEEDQVRETVTAFQEAVKVGDYSRAASFLTGELKVRLRSEASAPAPATEVGSEDAIAFLRRELAEKAYQECRINAVAVKDATAIADLLPSSGGVVQLHLARQGDGSWLISLPAADPLQDFQTGCEQAIKKDRAAEKAWEGQERIDQDIADDVNEDRFR
ncbi:MAG TPA: hypothetical protein PLI51_05385 [bacterium]|nr:hypothetical protein [bacterium]HPQ66146.1 hypothetical protein [bacterium]